MKSGVSAVRVQCQLFLNDEELAKMYAMYRYRYELADKMRDVSGTRDEWVRFFELLGMHADKLGKQARETIHKILSQYGTDEALESLRAEE